MSRRTTLLLIVALIAAACACLFAGAAAAVTIPPPPDFCAAQTADATLGVSGSASSGVDYAAGSPFSCQRYVVDVHVPSGPLGGVFEVGVAPATAIGGPLCGLSTWWITTYRKGAFDSSFNRVDSYHVTNSCAATLFTPPVGSGLFGAYTFRVAAALRVGDWWWPIEVSSAVDYIK